MLTISLVSIPQFSSVQLLTCVWLFVIPWTAACQPSLSFTNSRSLLKLMSIKSVMPSNHLILSRPLLLLPSIIPSIRVFSNESVLRFRWPKYWSFSFSISPSNEYSGLISFRIDRFDLLSPRNSQESSPTPQFKTINSLVLRFLYGPTLTSTTGKTIALTRWTFVAKVMSLRLTHEYSLNSTLIHYKSLDKTFVKHSLSLHYNCAIEDLFKHCITLNVKYWICVNGEWWT